MIHLYYPDLCPACGFVHKLDPASAAELRPFFDAAATVQLRVYTGVTTGAVNGEAGFTYSREDSLSGTTPVPIPTATGTNYSWLKWLALAVVSSGTTSMSNRRIQLSSAETSGLGVFFASTGTPTYVSASSGNMLASAATNGPTTPGGWSRASPSSAIAYDAVSTPTSATGRNGQFLPTSVGVDSSYAGGAGSAVPLPDIRLIYDEA